MRNRRASLAVACRVVIEGLEDRCLFDAFAAHVNFQPAGTPVPSGYVADTGAVYGARGSGLTYGWDSDNSAATRDRNASNSADQRYDTLAHMQLNGANRRWEIAVPNATYHVHIAAGDAGYFDSTYRISAEGTTVVSGQPNTAMRWFEGTADVAVSDGRLTIANAAGSVNNKIDFIDISAVTSTPPPSTETPSRGSPLPITGTIEAEDFDNGGEGVAYHDSDAANRGGAYRSTGVDIQSGGSNGFNIGYTSAGEWLKYTVSVAQAGSYVFHANVASSGNGGAFHVEVDGVDRTGSLSIPNTGGWQSWQTISSGPISLSAGTHVLRVALDRNGYWGAVGNFDKFTFSAYVPTPPSTNLAWSSGAPSPIALAEAESTVVNGKLYVFGGYDRTSPNWLATARADAYDPNTNTWMRIADVPSPFTHAGIASDSRYIYLAGGYISNFATGQQSFATTNTWRYDTQTNTWSSFVPLPEPRGAGAMTLLGRELHYFGGVDPSRAGHTEHWVLNLDDATPHWTATASLPFARNHLATVVLNNRIYAIGGQEGIDDRYPTADVLLYWDPAHPNQWSHVADLPHPLSHMAAISTGSHIIVMAGEGTGGVPQSTVLEYDPTNNGWSSLTSLGGARLAPVGGYVNGRLVLTTGYAGGGGLRPETWVSTPIV